MLLGWGEMGDSVHRIAILCTVFRWLLEQKKPLLEGGLRTAGAKDSGETPSSPQCVSYQRLLGKESLFWKYLPHNKEALAPLR